MSKSTEQQFWRG